MDDELLDAMLSMVENPTRRKILSALAREPHYPLQLSREIGVSAQAIMKNLDALERNGMVVSYRENSSIGPARTVYQPSREFTLVVDMRGSMFSAHVNIAEDAGPQDEVECDCLQDARGMVAELDRRISELERERSALIRERERVIDSVSALIRDDDYAHRRMLRMLLDEPVADATELSKATGVDPETVKEMENDIDGAIRRRH